MQDFLVRCRNDWQYVWRFPEHAQQVNVTATSEGYNLEDLRYRVESNEHKMGTAKHTSIEQHVSHHALDWLYREVSNTELPTGLTSRSLTVCAFWLKWGDRGCLSLLLRLWILPYTMFLVHPLFDLSGSADHGKHRG